MVKIKPAEFILLSKYIFDISGIFLAKGKEYLIETRLNPILEENGLKSYSDLCRESKREAGKKIEKKIIDAISTNETYFFRDMSPFNLLQHKIFPDLIDTRTGGGKSNLRTNIRLWSAANSTGQEIYSIAMLLSELSLDEKKVNIKLLGTDISDAAIAQASYGKYNKFEVSRGLTANKLQKFFNKDGDLWKIKDEIRAMVMFRKMNLMKPFIGLGKFDLILCRNVMIYFTPEDRRKIYKKIASCLAPDGYLIIGATESLTNDTDLFKSQRYLNSVFYQLK
ncbi:MAG: chemotaxis protein CheR [Desulfobacteraceae bacterium 4572_19]|nr:MAG: chemotaxis protein CheR [Desulfobacteraceae bacterium 4572_19]